MSQLKKILAGFPNKDLLPILGIPNYKTIKELDFLLSANTASVHSSRGNGALGKLAPTVSNAMYDTLSGCEFTTPTNLGATVDVPTNSTLPQIAALE